MNNGLVAFGTIKTENIENLSKMIHDICTIFNQEPNIFIISGGKHSTKPMTSAVFEKSLTKHGFDNIYMVDAMVKMNNKIIFYFSIFFGDEKSNIKISYCQTINLEIATKFWEISKTYMELIYGFSMDDCKFSPILYSVGTHIYTFRLVESLVKKEQIQKEKYWIHNYSKAKNGLIRDLYNINLLNEAQLSTPIINKISLREHISSNDLGELLPFDDNMSIWCLHKSDIEKIDQLKKICNKNTILNSSRWITT